MYKKFFLIISLLLIGSVAKVSAQNILSFKQKKEKVNKPVSTKKQAKIVDKQKAKDKKAKEKSTKAAKKQHYNNQGSTPAGRKRKKQMKKMERNRKKGKY